MDKNLNEKIDKLMSSAQLQKEKNNLDASLSLLKKILNISPKNKRAFNNIGNIFLDQGKFKEAMVSYNQVVSLRPDFAIVYNGIGNVFRFQDKLEEAEVAYNKALSINPNYASAHRNLSLIIKYKADNPQIVIVKNLIKYNTLNDQDRCYLNYVYAKMNEDLGDFKTALNLNLY